LIKGRKGFLGAPALRRPKVTHLSSQGRIPDEIIEFLNASGGHSLIVKGQAGTGKTTFALQLTEELGEVTASHYLSSRVSDESLYNQFKWLRERLKPAVIQTGPKAPRAESKVARDALDQLTGKMQAGEESGEEARPGSGGASVKGDIFEIPIGEDLPEVEDAYKFVDDRMPKRSLILIDSIDALAEHYGIAASRLINVFQKDLVEGSKQNVLYVLEGSGETRLDYLGDGVVNLSASEHEGRGRVWLLVDGVYSMYGDIAPAAELAVLLDRHPALHIYCDDAHGLGWDGMRGRGVYLARAGWHERLVVVAGLSKSFGATGGVIVVPDAELAEMIELVGPPLTFGGPIPPASLGAAVASADIHLSDELPQLQAELQDRIALVNRLAVDMGLPFAKLDPTPIWYLEIGDYDRAAGLCVAMREAGFFVNGSAFPVVPYGHAGVRFTVTLYNSPEQIEAMLTALRELSLEIVGETEVVVDLTADAPVGETT